MYPGYDKIHALLTTVSEELVDAQLGVGDGRRLGMHVATGCGREPLVGPRTACIEDFAEMKQDVSKTVEFK